MHVKDRKAKRTSKDYGHMYKYYKILDFKALKILVQLLEENQRAERETRDHARKNVGRMTRDALGGPIRVQEQM